MRQVTIELHGGILHLPPAQNYDSNHFIELKISRIVNRILNGISNGNDLSRLRRGKIGPVSRRGIHGESARLARYTPYTRIPAESRAESRILARSRSRARREGGGEASS